MTQPFTVKSFEQTRTDYLRTYRSELIQQGVEDPDVGPGTAIYVKATAIAQECSSIGFNLSILANDVLPDTAQGDQMLRHGRLVGKTLRPAGVSDGPLVFVCSVSPVAVITGAQLIDPGGLKYKVSVGGSYSNGDQIPIESIDTGSATNLPAGTVLKWTTPPAYAAQRAAVGPGGLTGGIDKEDIEGLRVRTLDAWRAPGNGVNPAQLAGWAEESSPAVQKAFVVPCYDGPATAAIVVVGAPTATSKERTVNPLVVAGVVTPAVFANLTEGSFDLILQSVSSEGTSVSFGLSLPDYATGLGWLNASPWPVYASSGFANVTAVTNSTVFTVHADNAPEPGITQVCWLAPNVGGSSNWKLFRATVVSYTGTGPTWTITIDTPFVSVSAGHWISPAAVNAAAYFAAVLAVFAGLGPGEKTSLAGLLPRARRQPLSSQSWPNSIGPSILKFLSNVGPEVLDVQFLYRSQTTPSVPPSVSQPPNILVPNNVGLYPLP